NVSAAGEFTADNATIGLWNFNNDLADSAWMASSNAGTSLTLTTHGAATRSSANLGWMSTPSGQALRVANVGDYVDVKIPDRLLQASAVATPISIEARFYIANYKAYGVGTSSLFSLAQDYDTQLAVSQGTWDTTASASASSGKVLATTTAWGAAVSKNAWHLLTLTFDSSTLASLYIDGILLGSVIAPANTGRTNDWTFTLGNFDGYIDDIRISNIIRGRNVAPVVSAGGDQNILKAQTALLDGSITDDGLPTATVTSTWSMVSGPGTVTFGNVSAVDTTATFSAGGTYVLRLTASDSALSTSDDITINVVNARPVVNAGSAQDIIGLATNLSGTVTDDGLPNPPASLTYLWSKTSGPGTVTFSNASATSTTVTFSMPGHYVLRLRVGDSSQSGYDEVSVIARPANAYEYTSDANTTTLYHFTTGFTDASGHGYTLTAAGNTALAGDNVDWMSVPAGQAVRVHGVGDTLTVSLPDSAIMPNNAATLTLEARLYIKNYAAYGVATALLVSLSQDYDSAFNLYQDMWTQYAQVNASSGVAIVSAANWNAGFLQNTWHAFKLTFTGGLVSCYVDGNLLGSATAAPNYGRSSNWTLTLGNFDGYIDEVRVSNVVRTSVSNQAPQVNAGLDQTIVLPTNLVNLTGTATDDGLPNPPAALTYTWSKTSGPGTVNFGNANPASTTATISVARTYVVQRTAGDSALSNFDEMIITVNPQPVNVAPTVNAGIDQILTLPAAAALNGTATDDGLPNPPAALTYTWSKTSGPGTVSFGNANLASTTASFST
ncbi:MAG: LamG-like jellyroll fold domain-containing protein, partial [Phycisphaerae bacterium]